MTSADHFPFLIPSAFLRGLVMAVCLALSPRLAAQGTANEDFSAPPEIQNRLAAVRAEIQALPAEADTQIRIFASQLETAHNDLNRHQEAGRRHAETAGSRCPPNREKRAPNRATVLALLQ